MLRYNDYKEVLPEDMCERDYKLIFTDADNSAFRTLTPEELNLQMNKYKLLEQNLQQMEENYLKEKEDKKEMEEPEDGVMILYNPEGLIIEKVIDIQYEPTQGLGSFYPCVFQPLDYKRCSNDDSSIYSVCSNNSIMSESFAM